MFIFISSFATDSWVRCARLSGETQLLNLENTARSKQRHMDIKM